MHLSCNILVFDYPLDCLSPALNNWPRQLGGLQVRWWQYNKEEIGTNDFCMQQIRSKKMQLHVTFCGLKERTCTCSCCTTLKQLSPNVKKMNYSQHLSWHAMTPRFQLLSTWIASEGNAALHTFWLGHPCTFPIYFSALMSMVEISFIHVINFVILCDLKEVCVCVCLCVCVCACDVLLWKDNTSHFSANWCASATYVGTIVE